MAYQSGMTHCGTALVTGGAVRIGRAIVEALSGAGYAVVIHCRQSSAAAVSLCDELHRQGRAAWVVRGRLDSTRGIDAVWQGARRAAGTIDVLVNNAAVFNGGTVSALTAPLILAEFWPNLIAPMLLTRRMAEQHLARGAVVNMLDRRIAAIDPTCIPYELSKKSLAEFTRTAALALAPGIRVNAVAPGPILPPPGKPHSHVRERGGRIPLGQPIELAAVAAAVLALLKCPSTTGQILYVDGGQHLLGSGV